MDKDGVFLTTAVLPLAVKYTEVAKWNGCCLTTFVDDLILRLNVSAMATGGMGCLGLHQICNWYRNL